MAPTILIVGATGNTGRAVTETLPTLLKANENFKNHRVLALTRSLTSSSAQLIAKIPGVEIIEKNWTDITSDWLREHEVVRAFIASHNAPNQFAEESAFHVAALGAGVEYVVRISTTAPNPNVFLNFYMALVAEYIKQYKRTGELGPLKLMASKDAPVAPIHPDEVGVFAAHLLALDNPSPHSGAKYVLNGPEDITGEQLVGLVEKHIDTKVKDVKYQDLSFLDAMLGSQYEGSGESMTVIKSIKYAPLTMWEGKCNASTTSKEILDIAPPRRTPTEVLEDLLKA
nr:nmrA-like family protein [Aspergillus niger CBS 513.88]|eukprot:XP_001395595.2 nmrA-like family protein [Aspergillus niger CBS 513.88]